MNHYKDTTQQPNTLETLKTAQNDNHTKVPLLDMVKSILVAVLMIGLLLLISSYHQAHPKNNLQSVADMMDNNVTTKLQAVKPNRHSLAIFVPVIHGATNPMITTSTNARHSLYAPSIASYDGLIGVNTTPFTGNSPSRLLSVVESRHPLPLVNVTNLTKIKGVANNG